MRRTVKNFLTILVLTIMLGLCACHMKRGQRGYHISRSCRPVCKTHETCVIYRSRSGAPVTRCTRLDPHRIALDGTRIYISNHLVPMSQARRQQTHQMINPRYQTRLQNLNTDTLSLTGIHRTRSKDGRNRGNIEISSALRPHAPMISEAIVAGQRQRIPSAIRPHAPVVSEAINAPIVAEQRLRIQSAIRSHDPLRNEAIDVPIDGEQRPSVHWPNNDKIALRRSMENPEMSKFGVRPDASSKLVDINFNGVPARKLDVTLPTKFINKGVVGPPSDPPTNHAQPILENTNGPSSNNRTQCVSCRDDGCPTGQHCYHHMGCAIKICQPL